MNERIKLSSSQSRELENAAIAKDGKLFSAITKREGIVNLYRCQRCQTTNYLYPHLLHMEQEHSVTNYYKTLSNLTLA